MIINVTIPNVTIATSKLTLMYSKARGQEEKEERGRP